ncbi:MAG: ABC transporter permease, partial [Armatimonadetes bacterium]|nr:ABC transporter permease [Armatimonadota bacterium]
MTTALDFRAHFQAFKEVIFLLTRHRQLTMEMARREITDKYLGQVFGLLWILGHPLVLMSVYIFVFSFVFKMRLGGTPDMPFNYTIYLLSGLIPWLAFQEVLSKSSTVILANANLVKQVVFPIEILPVRGVMSSALTMAILFAMFTIYVFVSYSSLPIT